MVLYIFRQSNKILYRFMPRPSTGSKSFWAGPIFFWSDQKLIIIHFVPVSNILCHTKRWFPFTKFGFCAATKVFEEALITISILMSCPFTGPKTFCAGPNFLSQPKDLTAFSASSKTFVPAQKPILLNANHLFVWHKMFVTAIK